MLAIATLSSFMSDIEALRRECLGRTRAFDTVCGSAAAYVLIPEVNILLALTSRIAYRLTA